MVLAHPAAQRAVVGPALVVGALAASVAVAAGAVGTVLLVPLTGVLVGVVALAGIPVLLLVGRAPGRLPTVRLAGLAVALLMGASSVVSGLEVLLMPETPTFPSGGDLLGLAAAPFAVLLVLSVRRADLDALRLARLLPVALALGASAALLAWRAVLTDEGASSTAGGSVAGVTVLVVSSVVALLVAVAVIGRERGSTALVVGAGLVMAGQVANAAHVLAPDTTSTVLTAVLLCAGWPLVWSGLVLLPAGGRAPDAGERAAVERRSTVVTSVSITCAVPLVLLALGPGLMDRFSLALLAGAALGIIVHVVVAQHQHLALVRDLLHLADHDPMTGLGNRRALAAALSAPAAAAPPGSHGRVGVAVLNLDGLSAVNDRFGHRGGDAVLVAVAGALRAALPEGGGVFRLGGDEFVLVVPPGRVATLAVVEAARAAATGATASVPGMGQVSLSATCGVHDAPVGGDPMVAVGLASSALQAARRAGRDRTVVWSEDLAADDRRRDLVAARLRQALGSQALEVHLQPVVDVRTGRVVGFEALSRWSDAELGAVAPVEFVAVAEATGLVVALGRQVMVDALAALVATGGLERGMSVAVNASPVELRGEGFVASVADALARTGVPADLLVVEVTEAVFVSADDPGVAALEELASMGVSVAVDDFGTGYSSLSYLTRLPVHELKIDRSLTCRLHEGPTRAVVTALVAMADALGLEVVAEGVEETSQAAALAAMGVTQGQGWLWWRALPVAEAAALVLGQDRPDRPCPALADDLAGGAP